MDYYAQLLSWNRRTCYRRQHVPVRQRLPHCLIGGINNVSLSMDFDGIPDITACLSDLGDYIIN
jgi:hypothetical protein